MLVGRGTQDSQKVLTTLPNKVVQILQKKGLEYKTFGSNIIILLNRERKFLSGVASFFGV